MAEDTGACTASQTTIGKKTNTPLLGLLKKGEERSTQTKLASKSEEGRNNAILINKKKAPVKEKKIDLKDVRAKNLDTTQSWDTAP